jgi:hypothetical protein
VLLVHGHDAAEAAGNVIEEALDYREGNAERREVRCNRATDVMQRPIRDAAFFV